MKFLCTKVKKDWLTIPHQVQKITDLGLTVQSPFIGIEITEDSPNNDEYMKVNEAIDALFGNHKKAFPIRLMVL